MKYLSVLTIIFVFIFSNIFGYILEVRASGFGITIQKVSTDISSTFSNPQDNLGVNPGQEFRLESIVENKTGGDLFAITYYSNFPSGIIYNTTTTSARQIDGAGTYVIPLSEFYPPSTLPNYVNNSSVITDGQIYMMRRIVLKFPTNWGTYENILSNYFSSNGGSITSDTRSNTIWVNVRPHITDYYFEKNDGSETTNQVQGSNSESINLVLKVKDYNSCSNISGGTVQADLSSIGLGSSETLSYVSCEGDGKTGIFKKTGITTNSSLGDYSFDVSKFSATDIDGNTNTPDDPNTNFDDEDKKSSITLTIVPSLTPVVSLVSLSENLIGGPEKQTTTLQVTSTSSGSIKAVVGGNSACTTGTILENWNNYVENTTKSFVINSSSLSEGTNNIVVCLSNNGYTGSLTKEVIKDSTSPNVNSLVYTANVALNNSNASFACSENGYFAGEIGGNGTYGSGTGTLSWTSTSAGSSNVYTLQNSLLNTGANPFYVYCKDEALNISYATGSVTKTIPILSMDGLVTSFSDNDIDNEGLDGRDIFISWQKPNGDISNFYSYQIYILPSNINFNSATHGNNYIAYIDNEDITSFTGTANIKKDSTNNDLVSGTSYRACVVIRGDDLNYGTAGCSAPAVLTSDVVQNAKILSAKFTGNTTLELTTDATLDTDLSSHSGSLISYNYNSTTHTPISVLSVNGNKINFTIQPLNNSGATGNNIIMHTGALHAASGGFNNYFSSGGLLITDGQAPVISGWTLGTPSSYNGFYSTGISVGFTFAEQMKGGGSTKILFDRISGNTSSQKIFNITDVNNLTSGSKSQSLTLSGLLVSGVTYNMTLLGEDMAGNTTTSSGIVVKFDNVGPSKPTLNVSPNTSSSTPTLSWNASTDDSGNGSGVKEYILKLYANNNCSSSPTQTHNVSGTSKQVSTLTNGTYSFNVQAIDNMGNLGIVSDCNSFMVDTSIATISNLKITDTNINSTSFTKSGNTLNITATLTNTNSGKILADLSALTGNATHTGVLCSNPVSGVSCNYNSSVVTYSFNVAFAGSVSELVRQITLYVSNAGGTQTANSTASITVDNTAPTIGTISSPSGTIGGNSTNIVWSGINDTNLNYLKFEYSSNSGSVYNLISTGSNVSPYVWDISSLDSGNQYKIRITAYDKAGNSSIITSSNFTIDKDGPTIGEGIFTSVSSGAYIKGNTSHNLTWDSSKISDVGGLAANPVSLYYSTNSGSTWNLIASSLPNNGSYNWIIPSINSSNVKLQLVAIDNVGNTTSYSTPYSFVIDSTAPTFTLGISTPPNGVYVNSSGFNIEGIANDTNLKSISYSFKRNSDNFYWNGSEFVSDISWNILQDNISGISFNTNTLVTPSITNGENYDLVVKVSDYAGNEFSTVARRYTGDTVNPTLNINTSSGTYFLDNLTISGSSSDVGAGISSVKISIKKGSQYWDGTAFVSSGVQLSTNTSNNYANWNYTFNVPASENDGQNFEVIVYAYDSSYKINNSTSSTIGIILDKTSPNISDDIFTFDTGELYIGGNTLNITWNTLNITDSGAGLKTNPIKLEYFNDPNWILISDNLPNNGSYDFVLPQIDISNARIRISVSDKVGNISYKNSSSFIIDSTPPTISSVETMDLGATGKIDALKITMSENIKDSTITLANFSISDGIGTPTGFVTGNESNDNIFILTFSATGSTSLKPKLNYTAGTLTDIAGKNLASISNISSVDKAVPRVLTSEIFDNNSNGKLDTIEVSFSENISSTTDIGAFSITSKNILSSGISGNKAIILIDEGDIYDTSSNSLSLNFVSNSNWNDLAGNQAGSLGSPINIIDKASPVLVDAIVKDSNLDYISNRIELTFSESLTGTFAGFSTNTGSIVSTSYEAPNKIILGIENLTVTNPNILLSYSGNISDSNGNIISNISDYQVVDKIPPKLISATTLDQNGNGRIDGIYMNFSESLTGSFSDFSVTVNAYNLASTDTYSFSGANGIKINLEEKTISDSSVTPQVTLNLNTTLKDLKNNAIRTPLNSTLIDGIGPVIIGARFDEGLKNLYLTFGENVVGSLNNESFVLNNSTSEIVSTNFSSGSNTAILTLSNTGITYGSSEISFSPNTVSDNLGNKQSLTYFTKITASVVINEYMNFGDVKYIELKNISSSPVDIGGWTLENAYSTPIELTSYSLAPNSYYLISTNNTYFSGITADQVTPIDITGNIVLKNGNIVVDSAYYQASQENISVERFSNCSNPLSNSCWYEAVGSNGFVDSNYKGTPKSDNIFDATLPTLLSFSPENNTLFPFTTGIKANFSYEDNVGGVGIDDESIKLKIEKYNGSEWGNYNGVSINTGSITDSEANFDLTGFNTYGKYRLTFNVSDLAGNEVTQNVVFYLDDFKFSISENNVNLGTLKSGDLKLSDTITLEVQTIGAGFSLLHEVESPNNFPNWNGSNGYGLCIGNSCNEVLNYSSGELATQAKEIQEDGSLKTYTYEIRYGALINSLQEAGVYNFLNKNKINIEY